MTLQELVRSALEGERENPTRKWTLQGLGMLRTYVDEAETMRLHIWDSRFAVPGVSEMHTHPWDMVSRVVSGEVYNRKFVPTDGGYPYMRQKLLCGAGGGLCGVPERVELSTGKGELVLPGESYSQAWHEIHVSEPADGTVTLIRRVFGSDRDHAYVFWPEGEEWVSAEPRQAEYMLFPRLFALAEVVWSPQKGRNYREFLGRVPSQLAWLKRQGVHYRALDAPSGSRRRR